MSNGYGRSIHSFIISKQTLHIDQYFLPIDDYHGMDCTTSMTMDHDYLIVTGGYNDTGSVHVTLKLESETSSGQFTENFNVSEFYPFK